MKIQGKSVWITGASSGIGEALAFEFFNKGATVILSSRNTGKLKDLKNKLDRIEQGRCFVVPCDVTVKSDIDNACRQVKTTIKKLDILVNNAGVSQRSFALDTDIEIDRQLFEVNFFGAITITKDVLPWMLESGGGHIVVISSMAGKYGFRMRSSYSASKHALQGFFETLRAELHDKNVNVSLVCPGRIKTDISINSLTAHGEKYGKMDKGQAKGISVERCAEKIVNAVEKNRKEIFIGRGEIFLLIVKRICPPLFYLIVNRVSPT